MYDIFFIDEKQKFTQKWLHFKQDYPFAKNVSSFRDAQLKSVTKFFWVVWSDINISDEFDFSYTPDSGSQEYVHVFLNGESYDGVCLVPKKSEISENEIKTRFFASKKTMQIQASCPTKYDVFEIDSYEEYLEAHKKSKTELFYAIPSSVTVNPDFNFDIYFSHHNQYDRRTNHVLLNGKYHDGIILCSTQTKISAKEWKFKFIAAKKEHDILASWPKSYDTVYISYNEPNADKNYQTLLEKVPDAKRVHGVKGIHQAHIEAAKLANTDMFWVVDGDAEILDDFNFDYQVPKWQLNHVHVWRSKNPVNDLVYGYGGVKLLPRQQTIDMDISKPDMTTSISNKFVAVKEISNVTCFNTDPFSTWRSAFRECCKLASKTIDRQKDNETDYRLKIWQTEGKDKPYGEYAIAGAKAGASYGKKYKNSPEDLYKINDFEWLKEQFNDS
jgi:hypothetical protein